MKTHLIIIIIEIVLKQIKIAVYDFSLKNLVASQ